MLLRESNKVQEVRIEGWTAVEFGWRRGRCKQIARSRWLQLNSFSEEEPWDEAELPGLSGSLVVAEIGGARRRPELGFGTHVKRGEGAREGKRMRERGKHGTMAILSLRMTAATACIATLDRRASTAPASCFGERRKKTKTLLPITP
jgi:hypothetical protein